MSSSSNECDSSTRSSPDSAQSRGTSGSTTNRNQRILDPTSANLPRHDERTDSSVRASPDTTQRDFITDSTRGRVRQSKRHGSKAKSLAAEDKELEMLRLQARREERAERQKEREHKERVQQRDAEEAEKQRQHDAKEAQKQRDHETRMAEDSQRARQHEAEEAEKQRDHETRMERRRVRRAIVKYVVIAVGVTGVAVVAWYTLPAIISTTYEFLACYGPAMAEQAREIFLADAQKNGILLKQAQGAADMTIKAILSTLPPATATA